MHECDQGVYAEMGVTFIEACSERAKFVTHAKQNRVRSTEYASYRGLGNPEFHLCWPVRCGLYQRLPLSKEPPFGYAMNHQNFKRFLKLQK
jgi:hypothetical protein